MEANKMQQQPKMHIITPSYSYINSSSSFYPSHISLSSATTNLIKTPPPRFKNTKTSLKFDLPLDKPISKQHPQPFHSISDVLRLMDTLSITIPTDIYISLLKECTHSKDIDQAILLHQHILNSGLSLGVSLRNRFLLLFGYCGFMTIARQLFDEMHNKDSNSWAAMIAGYMSSGEYPQVIHLFLGMQRFKYGDKNAVWFPYSWILVSVIQACVETEDFELGRQIHGLLWKVDFEKNLFVCSSLIDFYGRNGYFVGADHVFDQVPCDNTVVWTARLVNKCREGRFDEAVNVFREMVREGVKRNSFTYSSVLKACGRLGDRGQCGEQIHAHVIKFGVASRSYVQCGLVDMYSKVGLVKYAKRVFDMNQDRKNGACWNAMLRGYMKAGDYIEAIKLLYEMKAADQQPHESLLNELRSACGSSSSV
ncbi:pentatricopeptide repeat-containing protein At1g31790 [Apium graveolens]|uniref:pentatricopeptide repeat-containing protein At1g31790 n=1 Tax=Apium graveolens TaxID=4045 RepID=UPI003D7B3CE7